MSGAEPEKRVSNTARFHFRFSDIKICTIGDIFGLLFGFKHISTHFIDVKTKIGLYI